MIKLIRLVVFFLFLMSLDVWAGPAVSKMYWVDSSDKAVLRANLDGANKETIVSGLGAPFGIAIDTVDEYIFWSDNVNKNITRADLDGNNKVTIVSGLENPEHLTVDAVHGKVYWTNRNAHKVQRSNLNGTGVEDIITGLGSPRGIDIDVDAGYLYVVDTVGTIFRSNLDGTGMAPLLQNLDYPFSITLDRVHDKMYWAEISYDKIRGANLDSSEIQDLVTSGISAVTGIDVDPYGGKLYFTDFHMDKIFQCSLDGSQFKTILNTGALPNDIALYIVPEPATVLLLGFGAVMLRRRGWRRDRTPRHPSTVPFDFTQDCAQDEGRGAK
jgi:low density lipoprotein receptor-related protein 5/6